MVWIVLFTLFVSVYGDVTHLYDAPRASEVNSIRHLSGVENGLPIHQPHAFQPTISMETQTTEEPSFIQSPSIATEFQQPPIFLPANQYVFFPLEALLRWQQANGVSLFSENSLNSLSSNMNKAIVTTMLPPPLSSSTQTEQETTTNQPHILSEYLPPQISQGEEIIFVKPLPKQEKSEISNEIAEPKNQPIVEQLDEVITTLTPITQSPTSFSETTTQKFENDEAVTDLPPSYLPPPIDLLAPKFNDIPALYASPILNALRYDQMEQISTEKSKSQDLSTTESQTTSLAPETTVTPIITTTNIPITTSEPEQNSISTIAEPTLTSTSVSSLSLPQLISSLVPNESVEAKNPSAEIDEELQSIITNAARPLESSTNEKLQIASSQPSRPEIIFSHVLSEHEGYKYKIIGIKTY